MTEVCRSALGSKLSTHSLVYRLALTRDFGSNRIMVVFIHMGNDPLSGSLVLRRLVSHCREASGSRNPYTTLRDL